MANVSVKRISPKASGYSESGASYKKRSLRAFIPNSHSPNSDINYNLNTLRQRSRMLQQSTPIAASAINTNRTKVVGTGIYITPFPNVDLLSISPNELKSWQNRTSAEFNLWAEKKENCDALCLNNFYGLQQLALTSYLASGDVFALIKRDKSTFLNPYTLRIHMIEADRICTPSKYLKGIYPNFITDGMIPEGEKGAGNKIFNGIEVDSKGKIIAYHIASEYPDDDFSANINYTRVEAFGSKTGLPNILQIMNSERCEQYRGVPYLAPVIEALLQLRRYTENEVMSAVVQAMFTAWIETDTDTSEIPINEIGSGDIAGIPTANPHESNLSYSSNEYELSPGTVTHLAKGEKIVFGSPNIPTAGFDTFVKTLCKLIGSALDLPYDVLIKEFNSSYSASRGALLEAWEAMRMRRKWLVDSFCQPIYEIWLSEAVATGRINAPGFFSDPLIRKAWCGSKWTGPIQGQLDPKKEAEAALLLAGRGLKTYSQITQELGGGNWHDNIEQLKNENKLLKEATKVINSGG